MNCAECNNEFVCMRKHSRRRFCSDTCNNRHKSRKWHSIHGSRQFVINKPCEVCGSLIKFGTTKDKRFCSNKCIGDSNRKAIDVAGYIANPDKKLDKNLGYVRIYCPVHREANSWGYVYEHRVVAELMIGRDLKQGEIVHHKNGLRWDNREENLEVMTNSEHSALCGQSRLK